MNSDLIAIGGRKKVNPLEVMFLIAEINYTCVIFEDGNKTLVATTLGKLEKLFLETKYFYRTHRSFLVNLRQIERLEENKIFMKNNQSILVSRRKKETLKEILAA